MTALKHNRWAYGNRDCRCATCTADRVAYQAEQVTARRAARVLLDGRLVAPGAPHGTGGGYTNWSCRCPACTEANYARVRAWKVRRRAAAAHTSPPARATVPAPKPVPPPAPAPRPESGPRCRAHPEPLWDANVHGETAEQRHDRHARARGVCRACPLTGADGACSRERHPESTGIYGGVLWVGRGVGPAHRADVPQPRRVERAPVPVQPCGTEAAYQRHYTRGEEPCDACREAARQARRRRHHNMGAR